MTDPTDRDLLAAGHAPEDFKAVRAAGLKRDLENDRLDPDAKAAVKGELDALLGTKKETAVKPAPETAAKAPVKAAKATSKK